MQITRRLGAIALIAATAIAAAPAQGGMPAGISVKSDGSGGQILVNDAGMALYTYAKDAANASACDAGCAGTWRPLAAQDNASPTGAWSLASSADGTKMWAYKGKPLYTCARDRTPGKATCGASSADWAVAVP